MEPEQPCIRSCVRDCRCEECLVAPAPVHDPVPVPAIDGQLCRTCSSRLARWLGAVLDDTLRLNTRIPDNYGWDHGHTHSKVSGSPALCRLDVLALTDPRTTQPHHSLEGTEFHDPLPPKDIPGVICEHASRLKDDHNLTMDATPMAEAVHLLTCQWERLVNSDWIEPFYDDMATIRQLLNAAHNWRPPVEVGKCFTCEEEIRKQDGNGSEEATCHKCQRVYDGPDLFKVQLQKNHDRLDALIATATITSKDAREYLRLKYPQYPTPRESTIRSWLTRGNVTTTNTGGIDIKSMEQWFTQVRDQKQAHRRARRAV